ncbi:MAG: 30S ribosomal protein S7 [Patescibacteria group bacterium]|nr:30S ribosomal protein S7 [Patescibacteria group bacterium]
MRGKKQAKKRDIKPDQKYNSIIISKFINKIMLRGQKRTAQNIVYKSLEIGSAKVKEKPEDFFDKVLANVKPLLEVKSKRIGGATYQVPMEVPRDRAETLAMRWIIGAARGKQGKAMEVILSEEMVNAYNRTGSAMTKRENTHKMAEANRAFAHYARF